MKYPQSLSMPSAVSDWLEEQLEGRGIDALLYSRYILSLLHTHTLDVIYPEDDLQFSRLRKEVRRSSGCSSKKVRRWRHAAQADAEQLKRSAAVECLMSASDQNCEIESLVDELCEKLKDINNLPNNIDTVALNQDIHEELSPPLTNKISPQELAEKYYAAFPPLCPNANNANAFLTNFIPQWIAAGGSPKKNKKKSAKRDVMKARANQNFKQRFCYNTSAKKDITSTKTIQNFATNKDIFEAYDMNNWEFFNDDLTPKPPKINNNLQENQDQIVTQEFTTMENDEENMLYEDLPVDISDLLSDSPLLQDDTVNNNMKCITKQYNFIPFGTNITSSIWSNDEENKKEATMSFSGESWPDFGAPEPQKSDTAVVSLHNNEQLFDVLTMSLLKINHNKEKSGFTEIVPKSGAQTSGASSLYRSPMFKPNKNGGDADIEDLLTSEKSHFKPITEKMQGDYENGATFVISNNIDKVNYKRSESGTMYLENEQGQNKKYHEYRDKETSLQLDFVLKFCVCQNDKACQTDTDDVTSSCSANIQITPSKTRSSVAKIQTTLCETANGVFTEQALDIEKIEKEHLFFMLEEEKVVDPKPKDEEYSQRPESVMCEVSAWKYEAQYCDKCNNNKVGVWKKDGASVVSKGFSGVWDNSETLKNIWDGKEVCHTCLRLNGGGAVTPRNSLLREDISQDGEQLLSDLSSLQKSYMESFPPLFKRHHDGDAFFSMETDADFNYDDITPGFPAAVTSSGFSGVTSAFPGNGSWSFASRLEEDCLGAMTSLPTLRSVTL